MEARFQRYRGRVRLLYMYVREAHPNPAQAPCGSTEELGWAHPSGNTRSVAERAQRARWLKNDFNLNFPWIIDDIADTIYWDYWPNGFYVGWLIDCDGTVLMHAPWGWATSSTQWCGLPLADFADLDAFLESYLADPPPCYRGVKDRSHVSVIPAAAHTSGASGTSWVSDLSIANPGTGEAQVRVRLQPWNARDGGSETREWTLAAGSSLELRDVLATTYATEGTASLLVESDLPVVATSRTFNDTPNGTYGQLMRALPSDHAIGEDVVGHLLMLEESPRYRTNIGVIGLSDQEVEVQIEIFGADGDSLGIDVLTIPPHGAVQRFRMIRDFTERDTEGARAAVRVLTPGGRVMAYASVIDNATGDPTTVEPIVNPYQADIGMPGAARIKGANATRWVTDMVICNLLDEEVTATVQRHQRDAANVDPDTTELTLAPGQSLLIRDALETLFDARGAASVAIHASRGVVAAGRTYNDAASGTFGQLVPGIDISADAVLRPGTVGHLLQLEESGDDGRRTNLGLVNASRVPTGVEIRFFDESGLRIGVLEQSLPPFGYVQLDRALRSLTGAVLHNARAEVRVSPGSGRIIAYAASVDNRSGDSVMQLGWPQRDAQ